MSNYTDQFNSIDLEIHGVRLPSFKIEDKCKREISVSEDIANPDFLKALCKRGLKEKKLKDSKYIDRVKFELKTLDSLGFTDYILLVWDVINFCKNNDIATGLGRGSAAGSLVLYLIGVTQIDPVKYELFFERFVSKVRAKKKVVDGVTYLDGSLMADIDMDICYHNRKKVLDYLKEKFKGKTSKILTFSTLRTKLLIKECGKIIAEKSEREMNSVSHMVPSLHGQLATLPDTYEGVEEFREWCDSNTETYEIALKIRGLIKNKGVHASAIAISYDNLEDSCPTELTSVDKTSVSAYDMNWISLFNVKLDVLGLKCVSVVDDVCKNIGISVDDIDLNDKFIYQQLFDLRNKQGLFHIEADVAYKVCKEIKPKNLEDLSAVVAIARPGALQFQETYAKISNGEQEATPIHEHFNDIVKETHGTVLYQEQLMKMAHRIGFSLDDAEVLRRIVGKKKVNEVKKWKKKINNQLEKENLDPEIGPLLWKILEDSANYSFNKSHSISYASLTALTVYLKFKYPQQFFLSLLKMSRHEQDSMNEIAKIHREMLSMGIDLLRPDLLKSEMDFSVEGDNIRFGLLSIKGISDKSIDKLNNFKNEYSTKFQVFEAAQKADCKITIGNLSALIQAGALETFSQSRTKTVYECQLWNILTTREKALVTQYGDKMDYDLIKIIKYLFTVNDENDKPFIKRSRQQTIRKKQEPYKQIYLLNTKNKKTTQFANWFYEKTLLGYTYGTTLKDLWHGLYPELTSLQTVNEMPADEKVAFIGFVSEKPKKARSRKGSDYLLMFVSDEKAQEKVMIFNDKMKECIGVEGVKQPQDGEVVIVRGVKKDEVVFADTIVAQRKNQIYTKLSSLDGTEVDQKVLTNNQDAL